MPLRLEPMTPEQFDTWLPATVEAYAADIGESGELPDAAARDRAERQIGELLSDGAGTADHHVLAALDGDAWVGSLWLRITDEAGGRRAFVFYVAVAADRRGRGYGRQIMLAGERYARGDGAVAVDLNVFGPNRVARNLYESLGYVATSINMRKHLDGAGDTPPS